MTQTLIIGGARSGKSRFAQELALKTGGQALFVATAEAGDDEMKQRIEAHRQARPSDWKTLEATTKVGSQIKQHIGQAQTVLIDCITLLVSNIIRQYDEGTESSVIEKEVMTEIAGITDCAKQTATDFIIVTNEVGLGLVPDNKLGRLYRDLLGKANQVLAQNADEVIMMVAGLPVKAK